MLPTLPLSWKLNCTFTCQVFKSCWHYRFFISCVAWKKIWFLAINQSWKHCLCTGSKSKGWPWPCNNSIFATCFQLRRLMITFFLHLQKPPKGPHPPKVISKPPIVPDFDKSYQSFLRSMKMKKMSKPTTVIQPFSFDDEIDVRFFSWFLVLSLLLSVASPPLELGGFSPSKILDLIQI